MTNKEYVAAREVLIPEAILHAKQVAGPRPTGERRSTRDRNEIREAWNNTYNKAFHDKMTELCKQGGLIR